MKTDWSTDDDEDGSVPVPETMTRPATPAAEATGHPDPEWLALLDRARAGGEDAADAVCDAYSRGIRVGLRRAAEAILPAAVTTEETHELTAELVGLEPDQEIRDRALERAEAMPLGWARQLLVAAGFGDEATVLDLADLLAAYIDAGRRPDIRDGSKP